MIRLDEPWLLALLPLALLPWWRHSRPALANGWLPFAPRDRASVGLGLALRALASLTIAATVLALAQPQRSETTVERVGRGAEIALVLDRSRSMDQGFAPRGPAKAPSGTGPEALDYYFSQAPARLRDSKGKVARDLLAEFTEKRPQDRFALVVFSTQPIRVLDFTHDAEVIQAAIAAGNVGRGLSETRIGAALEAALELFAGRPYTGSRIVMLVSDGGDRLDPDSRERLAHALAKLRVTVYWLYLRTANSASLAAADGDADAAAADSVPELALHRFFGSLATPYRAYEASDGEALKNAIADVGRLENLPIVTHEVLPRRDLTPPVVACALAGALLMLGASLLELRQWR